MRLNKHAEYGILLYFYLCRSGRAELIDIHKTLHLDFWLLEEVAIKLAQGGILDIINGYEVEIIKQITFIELLDILDPLELLKTDQYYTLFNPNVEHRALSLYSVNMRLALNALLNKPIHSYIQKLIESEVNVLDRFKTDGAEN